MNQSNAANLLGLALAARKVVSGDLVLKNVRSKRAKLVIIARDASANTQKKLMDKCTFYEIPYVFIEQSMILNKAMGTRNRMSVALIDEGFAQKLHTCLKG